MNKSAKDKLDNKSQHFGNPLLCAVINWGEITQKLNKVKGRFFVYLLLKNEEVIYVGRSFNLSCRLYWHKYRKEFDKVYLAEYKTYAECCKAEKKITNRLGRFDPYNPVSHILL